MSSRKTRLASEKHLKNVTKRGMVPKGKIEDKGKGYSVGPCLLFFFLFVVIGSTIFQILKEIRRKMEKLDEEQMFPTMALAGK